MNTNQNLAESVEEFDGSKANGGLDINFKRVTGRVIKYWYLIFLSVTLALSIAYIINRYSTKIYPVSASIIIKENEENIGSKFLYNNELLNPYRNFYNEIYIMKSYPLLQEVMETLKFDISLYREGDVKTTEYYDSKFPIEISVAGKVKPYNQAFYLTVLDDESFTFERFRESEEHAEGIKYQFGDSLKVGGVVIQLVKVGNISGISGKRFLVRFNNPLSLAKAYASKLKAGWAQQGASLVNLEVNGPIAEKEVDFLNKFIERYQFYDVEKKNKAATMALRFLEEQLYVIGDSLELYEDQVENFKKRNVITNLEEETNRLYQRIQDFEEQKLQTRLVNNYFDYIINILQSEQYEGIFTPTSVGITDEVIAGLISELIEARTEVNLYKSRSVQGVEKFKENPRLQQTEQRIRQLKADIIKTIENTRKVQQINLRFINDQISVLEKELRTIPHTERELVTIQRNYSLRENLYVFLLQKRAEAGLSKASTTSDIVVVNPPMAGSAISPKTDQNYLIAGIAGLILPIVIIVIIELINNRIQSIDDIQKITSVPIIGAVGHNPVTDPLIVYNKPRSAMAESFRALRSNLNYFTGGKSKQVFLVTSSIPGEGKSFTTLNLATVFSLAGKKTLIIGADLRRPKLYEELEVDNSQGLSQYLSGMIGLEKILFKTKVENLYLLPSGQIPPNPSELLLRPELSELLKVLLIDFDLIIMDTPPLGLVTDAFVLSRYADHTLFVVRQDYTPKGVLHGLNEVYTSEKISNASILFNDLRKVGLGYGYDNGYSYNYSYNYGYSYIKDKGRNSDYYQE